MSAAEVNEAEAAFEKAVERLSWRLQGVPYLQEATKSLAKMRIELERFEPCVAEHRRRELAASLLPSFVSQGFDPQRAATAALRFADAFLAVIEAEKASGS